MSSSSRDDGRLGTALGSTFEEMAALIEKIPLPHRQRVGVCVDTAHIFAAGYDIVNDYDGVWARFDDVIGRSRLWRDAPEQRRSH